MAGTGIHIARIIQLAGLIQKGLNTMTARLVGVDKRFGGRVTGYGDFSNIKDKRSGKYRKWESSDGWRDIDIKPGEATNPGMDVDMVKVEKIDKKGNVVSTEWWWIPGASTNFDGTETPSYYYVDEEGNVKATGGAPVPAIRIQWPLWWYQWDDWIDKARKSGFPIMEYPMVKAG